MMITNIAKKLLHVIENSEIDKLKILLQENININDLLENGISPLGYSIDVLERGGKPELIHILLKYGANPNNDNELIAAIANGCENDFLYISIIRLLLLYGADPNLYDKEEHTIPIKFADDNVLNSISILLSFGATVQINNSNIVYNSLESAIIHAGINTINLLLNNGADTTMLDEYGDDMLAILKYSKQKYTPQDYKTLQTLLNPNNPPYLKLGKTEDSKYIIYENRKIDDRNYEIYLLTNKQTHKDKQYLYADNKIDAFVYWCYKHDLLNEPTLVAVGKYVSLMGSDQYTHFSNLVKDIMGDKLTTDYFNEAGKAFATSYLTVTHWWYNLHTDFNRLYQDEGVKLPRAIKSQEEFEILMKLLDIRHEQFKSGKDFNSNQNKEELQALIEGREPPKRVVDLSFLEETDSLSENTIIPDDFMKE